MDCNLKSVEQGRIAIGASLIQIESLEWNNHPAFTGVALKHLVTAKDTDGHFSCHIVRVKAGCEIGNHIHVGKWELHEVIQGQGHCMIGDNTVEYCQGVVAVIPADLEHAVAAEEDLYLQAKFIPALL